MTLLRSGRHHDSLRPQAEILRIVQGCEGEVEMEVICEPRPNFARGKGHFEDRGKLGFAYAYGADLTLLRSEKPLICSNPQRVEGRFNVRCGAKVHLSLSYTSHDVAVIPTLGSEAFTRVEETRQWWLGWVGQCVHAGDYRDAVVRSALALKLLNYSLSGAVVAAATTSLPEVVGGMRNWDYRFCWLRDATLTLEALMDLGFTHEAESFMDWLLHTTRVSWPRLNVLYDIYGESQLDEIELDHLEGYKCSQPVRIGNGAQNQLQMDIYGSVIRAAHEFVARGGELDASEKRCLVGFGRQIVDRWRDPDEGVWEVRGRRAHHTYSKIMCWAGLDRLIKLAQQGKINAPVETFRREREFIASAAEDQGFNRELNSYVATFGGDQPDASLLLAARCHFSPADGPRMRGTFALLERTLTKDGLVFRYPPGSDGMAGQEGAFGIASFWAVEYLALAGRVDEACARFERLLTCANDLGLYAEEIDPESGAALGNFPQAFTHVGLITAALAIDRAKQPHREPAQPET